MSVNCTGQLLWVADRSPLRQSSCAQRLQPLRLACCMSAGLRQHQLLRTSCHREAAVKEQLAEPAVAGCWQLLSDGAGSPFLSSGLSSGFSSVCTLPGSVAVSSMRWCFTCT